MNLFKTGRLCHCRRDLCLATVVIALAGSVFAPRPGGALRAQTPGGALAAYEFSKDPLQYDLGKSLTEISGLAIDRDGRLYAHNDERARVYELDAASGKVLRSFRVGRNGLRGDFEGMAVAGPWMFLISSDGNLVRFGEGPDDASVEYTRSNAGTRRSCREIEGLEYDAGSRSLLLACKFTAGRALRDRLVVLRYSLESGKLDASPFLSVPLEELRKFGQKPQLSPSGIAIHPKTGTLFVVAAREKLLLEMERTGRLIGLVDLRGKVHHQPEGIAFSADGTLFIADEGRSGRATLTVYPPEPAGFPH